MALLGQRAVVPACVNNTLCFDSTASGTTSARLTPSTRLCSTASDPRDGVAASDARPEKKAAFPSAPLFIPVNLFSKFQVDSPWRIMTTVDFRRAPERRARWVARSNIATTLELLGLRLLRALAGTGSCGQCARDAAFSRINSLITRVRCSNLAVN